MILRNPLGRLSGFLNRRCAIQEFWKSGLNAVSASPTFPRLPQATQKGLCKADSLCEERVLERIGQSF
jgi:hypothetical protein